MGWESLQAGRANADAIKAALDAHYARTSADRTTTRPLASWISGGDEVRDGVREWRYYAAVRVTTADEEHVEAAVCLVNTVDGITEEGEVLVKHFTDRSLSAHEGCPAGILDHLTPTDHPAALEWRSRVGGCSIDEVKERAARASERLASMPAGHPDRLARDCVRDFHAALEQLRAVEKPGPGAGPAALGVHELEVEDGVRVRVHRSGTQVRMQWDDPAWDKRGRRRKDGPWLLKIDQRRGAYELHYATDETRTGRDDDPDQVTFDRDGNILDHAWSAGVSGVLHREDAPAYRRFWSDGVIAREMYWRNGVLHRSGGPADIDYDLDGLVRGTTTYLDGERLEHVTYRHDADGKRYEAYCATYRDGKISSETFRDEEGRLHRLGGPALITYRPDESIDRTEWYEHGARVQPGESYARPTVHETAAQRQAERERRELDALPPATPRPTTAGAGSPAAERLAQAAHLEAFTSSGAPIVATMTEPLLRPGPPTPPARTAGRAL